MQPLFCAQICSEPSECSAQTDVDERGCDESTNEQSKIVEPLDAISLCNSQLVHLPTEDDVLHQKAQGKTSGQAESLTPMPLVSICASDLVPDVTRLSTSDAV